METKDAADEGAQQLANRVAGTRCDHSTIRSTDGGRSIPPAALRHEEGTSAEMMRK